MATSITDFLLFGYLPTPKSLRLLTSKLSNLPGFEKSVLDFGRFTSIVKSSINLANSVLLISEALFLNRLQEEIGLPPDGQIFSKSIFNTSSLVHLIQLRNSVLENLLKTPMLNITLCQHPYFEVIPSMI